MSLVFLSILLSCSFLDTALDYFSVSKDLKQDRSEQVQSEQRQLKEENSKDNSPSNTISNTELKTQQDDPSDVLLDKQPDYLFPSGEIDCETSCFNYLTRRGEYPDFIKNHFDNLGNKAMNECYQSAISQGKSVTDLNCKERAIQACVKNCDGSKPMEWRTRSRSDLQ